MHYVVFYSGGIMSYLAAKRIKSNLTTQDSMQLLFTDTLSEDEDCYRFLAESSNYLDLPITWLKEGRSLWELMYDQKFLANSKLDLCSRILKRELSNSYIKENFNPNEVTLVFGISWEEIHRVKSIEQAWSPYIVSFPMIYTLVPYTRYLQEVAKDGIPLPRLYNLGFTHNNCGGFCVKAGKKHFLNLLTKLPERYAYHEEKEQGLLEQINTSERQYGILKHTEKGVSRYMSLREYRLLVESKKENKPEETDEGKCGCFT